MTRWLLIMCIGCCIIASIYSSPITNSAPAFSDAGNTHADDATAAELQPLQQEPQLITIMDNNRGRQTTNEIAQPVAAAAAPAAPVAGSDDDDDDDDDDDLDITDDDDDDDDEEESAGGTADDDDDDDDEDYDFERILDDILGV